jgi:hypothetical protein
MPSLVHINLNNFMKFNLEYAKPTHERTGSKLVATLIIITAILALYGLYFVMSSDAEALRTGLIH